MMIFKRHTAILLSTLMLTSSTMAQEGWTTTTKGLVTVNSCYNPDLRAMEYVVELSGVTPDENEDLPWMAIGYRPTPECRMVTVDGVSEVVLVSASANGQDLLEETSVYHGALPALADVEADEQTSITSTYDSLVELDDKEGFALHGLSLPNETSKLVAFHYQEDMPEAPTETIQLMYGVGKSPFLGFHTAQGCFRIEEFPTCPGSTTAESSSYHYQQSSLLQLGLLVSLVMTLLGM